jgi:tetratricopeptide (TPR) repeat protein
MKMNKIFLLAAILFTASIHLFSQTAEEWKKRGNIEADSSNYGKAIEYYQKAIKTDSNYFDAYFNLGNTYFFLSEYDNAIKYFNKAITKNDTEATAFFALGSVYDEIQDYDNAIKMIKRGILLKPNSPEAYYFLAILYQTKGNLVYPFMYMKKAAQLGDSLARQYFIDDGTSWEDHFVKPDYDQIKQDIKDEQSNFYYPKLWDRYLLGDTTMTLEEKRCLYYGYVFNDNYSPYASASNTKEIHAILNSENPSSKEWENVVSLLNTALVTEPFNCKFLYYQIIAYEALNRPADMNRNFNKIRFISGALTSTGDGLSKETAIHVIRISNEYDYLFLNNLSRQSQALVNGGYDVLYLTPNEDGLEEMWFDVSQSFKSHNKLFDKSKGKKVKGKK